MEVLGYPHWEALTSRTQEAFHLIDKLEFINRFYLAGGTGLALHFGHRFSVDLDFFSADVDSVGPDQRSVLRSLFEDPTFDITYEACRNY